jgi:hypothetical protein
MMDKADAKSIAAELSGTEWAQAGVTGATATTMLVRLPWS